MRLGIFGGTFDPPHVGHLLVAIDAHEALQLDRTLFVPAAAQPLKGSAVLATATQRLAMSRLLIGEDPRFEVDSIEIDREGLSYTVQTLEQIAEREPGAELFFLVGADVLASFWQWKEPSRVRALATLVVLQRNTEAAEVDLGAGPAPIRLTTRRVDVSSTEIRRRIAEGRSIRGFVPDAIADYIARMRLYR